MRKILVRLAYLIIGAVAILVLCCLTDFWMTTHAHGQNVEGQPIASQYGSFQVTGQSIGGFSFPPATCQVPAGGKNIDAFTAGVPIKIIDGDPTKTEIATPSSVFIGTCTVNMATTYTHQPPYSLTSGTGGLQEALINAKVRQGGPNTIILDANWYEQVKPGVAATVIAAAHGSTSWGLVDVTTVPYTYYSWNGSQYVSAGVTPPSGAAGGVLSGTYPNPGLSQATAAQLTGPRVFNVSAYGADLTCATDSTAAVTNAQNAAVAAGGGTVYFPPGCVETQPFQGASGVWFVGAGSSLSTWRLIANASPVTPPGSGCSATASLLIECQETGWGITGLQFDGNNNNQTATSHGIYLSHVAGSGTPATGQRRVHDIYIHDTHDDGIHEDPGSSGAMTWDGIYVYGANGIGLYVGAFDQEWSNIDVGESGLQGIYFRVGSNRMVNAHSWFSGRLTTGSGDGYTVSLFSGNAQIQCSNCEAQDNQNNGLYIAGDQNFGNQFINFVGAGNNRGQLSTIASCIALNGTSENIITGFCAGGDDFAASQEYALYLSGTNNNNLIELTANGNLHTGFFGTQGSNCIQIYDPAGNTQPSCQNYIATTAMKAPLYQGQFAASNAKYEGGADGNTGTTLGTGIFTGGSQSGSGNAGGAILQAGADTSTGQQGFAEVNQSFTIASATTIGFVVTTTSTTDRVAVATAGSGGIGVAASVGGTNAQIYVTTTGKALTVFDGTPVVGDYACAPPVSTGTTGQAHDNGATACPVGQGIGTVTGQVSGTGAGATATVLLQPSAGTAVSAIIPGTNVTCTTNVGGQCIGAVTITSSATGSTAWSGITSSANTDTGAFSSLGSWTFTRAGTASTPTLSILGAPFAAGTGTTNKPQFYLDGTSGGTQPTSWSTLGTMFGENCPSAFTGLAFDTHTNGGGSLASITCAGSIFGNGGFTSGGGYFGNAVTTNATYGGGNTVTVSSASTAGSANLQGANNSSTGGAGNTSVIAGKAASGQQGFASMQQAFTTASALGATFEVVTQTATGDQVAASALGATNNVGIAQTIGGTSTAILVASTGKTTTRFDGTPVSGDFACAPPASTGTIGLAHDNGSTACPAGQKLGIVTGQVSGTGSGATATVLLQIGS